MEYIDGETLEKQIQATVNTPSHDDGEFLQIINRVGSKFAEVHAINIALGDTKPENILVGRKGEIYFLDFEQSSRNGDKVWDIAEFLFYTGHYISPFTGTRPTERLVKSFMEGYLTAGGNAKILKKVGTLKYTKVFGIFVFPHILFTISDLCAKVDQ
jgi:tRNA A-37 threonylcarbamoyl transferase component Bud32